MTKGKSQGFSLIELLLGIAIGSLILGVVVLFFTRGSALNREQFQQTLIVEEGRLALERMSDALRNSRNVDVNGNKIIETGEEWLIVSEPNEIQIYTDITGDNVPEKVRYTLNGDKIERGVTPVSPDGTIGDTEKVEKIVSYVQNENLGEPLFKFNRAGIRSVTMSVFIDTNSNQAPNAAHISTIVFPRAEIASSKSTYTPRLWSIKADFPQDPPVDDEVRLTTTNPNTDEQTINYVRIVDLNRNRLKTYSDAYPIVVNYQAVTVGDKLPGWYAWIGPINVGEYGGVKHTVVDQVPLAELCSGGTLNQLLSTCENRTVTLGPFSKTYKPIVRYIDPDTDFHDYFGQITLDFAGN